MAEKNIRGYLDDLEELFKVYLIDKAPALPVQWRHFIVVFLPWYIVIKILFSIPHIIGLLGIGQYIMPSLLLTSGGYRFLSVVVSLIIFVMHTVAIKPLFNKEPIGWNLLYWSVLLYIGYSFFSFSLGGILIGGLLPLYILFQIRSRYF